MRMNRILLAVAAGFIVCVTLVWFSTSIHGSEKTYEVRPEIRLPEYKTDTARAIDAYERMMNRYMSLTERNLTSIGIEIRGVAKKLDSIDHKLTELSIRIAKIEKALGIKQAKKPVKEKPKAETNNPTNKPALENQSQCDK